MHLHVFHKYIQHKCCSIGGKIIIADKFRGEKERIKLRSFQWDSTVKSLWIAKWELIIPILILYGVFGGFTTLLWKVSYEGRNSVKRSISELAYNSLSVTASGENFFGGKSTFCFSKRSCTRIPTALGPNWQRKRGQRSKIEKLV